MTIQFDNPKKNSIFVEKKIIMKKVLAIAFVSGLILASCAKKESMEETNTMMEEPDTEMVETAPITDSAAVAAPMAADSTMVK
jgi:hypothetical protein